MKQNHKIDDFIDIHQRLKELDISLKNDLYIFPENIDTASIKDEFVFTETAVVVKKLFKKENINIELLENNGLALRQRKSIDFYAPMIFIGYTIFSQNSVVFSIGINVLSNYISDLFNGTFGTKNVKLEIIIEIKPKKKYKKITYAGDLIGLKDLDRIIKSLK